MGMKLQSGLASFEWNRKTKETFLKYCVFKGEGQGPPKSLMSLTGLRIMGVVTEIMGATPSATVTFQAVSTPGPLLSDPVGLCYPY